MGCPSAQTTQHVLKMDERTTQSKHPQNTETRKQNDFGQPQGNSDSPKPDKALLPQTRWWTVATPTRKSLTVCPRQIIEPYHKILPSPPQPAQRPLRCL